jgi:hypothetical protein
MEKKSGRPNALPQSINSVLMGRLLNAAQSFTRMRKVYEDIPCLMDCDNL